MYKSMIFVDACFYPYFVHICHLHKTFQFAMGAGIDYMVDSCNDCMGKTNLQIGPWHPRITCQVIHSISRIHRFLAATTLHDLVLQLWLCLENDAQNASSHLEQEGIRRTTSFLAHVVVETMLKVQQKPMHYAWPHSTNPGFAQNTEVLLQKTPIITSEPRISWGTPQLQKTFASWKIL